MTANDARRLLEAHGFNVTHEEPSELWATFSGQEVRIYQTISSWWAVAGDNTRRVGIREDQDRGIVPLSDWLREIIREVAA